MNDVSAPLKLQMVPVGLVDVLNPRERNGKLFQEIVGNIKAIGLKKPIAVTPRPQPDGSMRFTLVCGEGRLKALKLLGEASIPAVIVDVADEEAFLMGLVENVARRHYRPIELFSGIAQLLAAGYDARAIAAKTGLTFKYVQGVIALMQRGEERLLVGVSRGDIPLNAALVIIGAGDDDKAIQTALQDAYEAGTLRGKQLMAARRVIERRKTLGLSVARYGKRPRSELTTSSLVRSYQKEVERQRLMLKKAEMTQQRLVFVVSALRRLMSDENFVNLLRAERLDTLPKNLAELMRAGRGRA
jgi:ParB family transcriptional regulator, chromosome partitioning protein